MEIDSNEPVPERVPLLQSRTLTSNEREILDFLVSGPGGRASLREQAEVAKAVATCSCGCPSIWLDGSTDIDAGINDDGSGHTALSAIQRKSRGMTMVTLHVIGGRLFELEIFGGSTTRPRIDPRKLEHAPTT